MHDISEVLASIICSACYNEASSRLCRNFAARKMTFLGLMCSDSESCRVCVFKKRWTFFVVSIFTYSPR